MLETTNKTKILVQAWPVAAASINRHLRSLHLKRDSYLNALLTQEIDRLAEEVDFRTTDDARAKIKKRLQELKPKPMTIVLDRCVNDKMQHVLHERNISRNAFFNRIMFFLVAKSAHLDRLDISYVRRTESLVKPLAEAETNLYDPFYNIRAANHYRFYTITIRDEPIADDWPSLFGLNCAISDYDWQMINTPAADLLADLIASL